MRLGHKNHCSFHLVLGDNSLLGEPDAMSHEEHMLLSGGTTW